MIEKISAVIITKNAAETINVTLDSLSGFKEVKEWFLNKAL